MAQQEETACDSFTTARDLLNQAHNEATGGQSRERAEGLLGLNSAAANDNGMVLAYVAFRLNLGLFRN